MLTHLPTVDRVLSRHAGELGQDGDAYRHHVYRIVNVCVALTSDDPDRVERIATAAVFHDLGIWTHRTFDYLGPSMSLATEHLARAARQDWAPEVTAMIAQHHKLTPYRGNAGPLVEPFRRADWIDVSYGVRTFGLPRTFVRTLYRTWPALGFHALLVRLTLSRLQQHPLSPLPMVKL